VNNNKGFVVIAGVVKLRFFASDQSTGPPIRRTWCRNRVLTVITAGLVGKQLLSVTEDRAILLGKRKWAAPVNQLPGLLDLGRQGRDRPHRQDRKSTRLNSSHVKISYAVFC